MNRKEKVMLEGKIDRTQERVEAVVRKMIMCSNLALVIDIVGTFILKFGIEAENVFGIFLSVIVFFIGTFLLIHNMRRLEIELDGRFNSLQMYVEVLRHHEERKKDGSEGE